MLPPAHLHLAWVPISGSPRLGQSNITRDGAGVDPEAARNESAALLYESEGPP
jgi:hypothetical protein